MGAKQIKLARFTKTPSLFTLGAGGEGEGDGAGVGFSDRPTSTENVLGSPRRRASHRAQGSDQALFSKTRTALLTRLYGFFVFIYRAVTAFGC